MGVAQKPGQKGCQALPSQGGMGGGRADEGRRDNSQGESRWLRSLKCRPSEDAPQAVAGQDRAN